MNYLFEVDPTEDDIHKLLDWLYKALDSGSSHYSGMTYEDGIMAMFDWLDGNAERPDKE